MNKRDKETIIVLVVGFGIIFALFTCLLLMLETQRKEREVITSKVEEVSDGGVVGYEYRREKGVQNPLYGGKLYRVNVIYEDKEEQYYMEVKDKEVVNVVERGGEQGGKW